MKKWVLGMSVIALILCSVWWSLFDQNAGGYHLITQAKWDKLTTNGTETKLNLELTYNNVPLAYDEASNTFFLPLAMKDDSFRGTLGAGADGKTCGLYTTMNLAKCDVTSLQKNNEAIPLLAVDSGKWEICYLKITGVPIVSFSSTPDVTAQALPVFALDVYDTDETRSFHTSCYTTATLHGNTSLAYEKKSLRLKLLKESDGAYKKANENLLGLRDDDDWVLNSLYADENRVRDKLAIDLWNELGAKSNPFGKSYGTVAAYCEVFINDAYQGLYLLMVPIDAKQLGMPKVSAQLAKGTEVIERLYKKKYTAAYREADFVGELPDPNMPDYRGGYFLKGDTILQNEEEWEPLRLLSRCLEADDETFGAEITQIVDQQNAIENWLFFQAIGGFDNALKNIYYAYRQNGNSGIGYFIPWDLNISFGCLYADNAFYCETDSAQKTVKELVEWQPGMRMMEMDANGSVSLAVETWKRFRAGALSDEAFGERVHTLERTLKDSGAFEREMKRYPDGNCNEDFSFITSYTKQRLEFIDAYLSERSEQ